MKSLAILAVGLFAALNANARLGWTLDQCRQKYGTEEKIVRDGNLYTPVYIFQTTYFQINTRLLNDKVAAIDYVAKANFGPAPVPPFGFYTQDVIDSIVRKNIGDQKLIPGECKTAGTLYYETKDGTSVYIDPPNGSYNEEQGQRPIISLASAESRNVSNLTAQQKAALSAREITAGL
jgi:hypothetical protein